MSHSSRFWPRYLSRGGHAAAVAAAQSHPSQSDNIAAEVVMIETDEDEGRDAIVAERRQGFDELLIEYQRQASDIMKRNVWQGTTVLTAQQLENLYVFLFRAMRSRIQQHFSTVFPQGVSGTSLTVHDVACTVCCLLLLDIAITDDDMASFALTVLPGQRVSLANCPPERRFAYFSFMSFKSVVPGIARGGSSAIDAFRRLIAAYFTLPLLDPSEPLGLPILVPAARALMLPRAAPSVNLAHPLFGPAPAFEAIICLRALLNAAFPLAHSEHFESRVSAFYYHVVSLEAQLGAASSLFRIRPDSVGDGVTASTSPDSVLAAAVAAQRRPSFTGTPFAASTPKHHAEFRKGQEVGRGAFGIVYEAVCVDDGTVIALKEVPLAKRPAAGTKRGAAAVNSIKRSERARPGLPQPPPRTEPAAFSGAIITTDSFASPPPVSGTNQVEAALTDDDDADATLSGPPLDGVANAVDDDFDDADAAILDSQTPAAYSNEQSVRLGTTLYDGSNIEAEVNMLRKLHHPNIVQYYGCQLDRRRGVAVILMEFVPKSLRLVLDNLGGSGLPDRLVAHYGKGVLQGLAYLHDHHIVHRDIKSANILVRNSGEVKVSDFGTAVVTQAIGDDDAGAGSSTVTVQGTPAFLAPEVLAGSTPLEPSDIWAFGGVLLELTTGRAPFAVEGHEALMQIAFQLLVEKKPPAVPEKVPAHIAAMITQCMAMDPCARPSARALLSNPFFATAL